ncbi:MAG: glucose-6-phosphate dehydrogenase assembly protein OpcA [Actinomycetota bacterium]|nr:glucose-6-phosphate dehydrogenase assembly protein OpcA [Actinomycetota bacterium]
MTTVHASDGQPRVLCRWSGRGVSVEQVEVAASKLRSGEETAATRTSVVNLAVVADDLATLDRTGSAMRRLGARHPGRTVLILARPEAPAGIDAEVTLHEAVAEGHTVWWEEVRIAAGGSCARHLDSVVAPLAVRHLPLAVWFPGALPPPGDKLAALADAVLVDVRFAEPLGWGRGDLEAELAALVELARRCPVVDLSWKRLTPWRELLAVLAGMPSVAPFLAEVRSAHVSAQPGPRRLLAGWLVSRLGLRRDRVSLEDALHASVSIHAEVDGRRATLSVERTSDERVVRAVAVVDGHEELSLSETLPEHGLTWSLARALSDLGPDPIYEHSLSAALGWGDER